MKPRPVLRPTVPSDLDKFLKDNPLPYRIRAWTGLIEDEIVAVGGIAYPPDGTHLAFFMCEDKAREYPVALHKAALMVLNEARQLGIKRLVTLADLNASDAAERWLARLGFEPTMNGQEQKVWVLE